MRQWLFLQHIEWYVTKRFIGFDSIRLNAKISSLFAVSGFESFHSLRFDDSIHLRWIRFILTILSLIFWLVWFFSILLRVLSRKTQKCVVVHNTVVTPCEEETLSKWYSKTIMWIDSFLLLASRHMFIIVKDVFYSFFYTEKKYLF